MKTTKFNIQARCRKTGRTVILSSYGTRSEAEAWRPSSEQRVGYKYFRIAPEA